MNTIIVRYAEIALKGKNQSEFVNQLADNICQTLQIPRRLVRKQNKQLIVRLEDTTHIDRLAKVFGIAWYAHAHPCRNRLEDIQAAAVKLALEVIKPGQSFAVKARRAYKKLPFTSQQLQEEVGSAIQQATQARVDLTNPDHVIYIYADRRRAYIHTQKHRGLGGLPVGVSGRVLCLLSGGLDSIAAAYLLAKRGAKVDFLHFHVYPNSEQVQMTKIPQIVNGLRQHTLSEYLYLASYVPFQMATLSLEPQHARYELVVFRRFMVRVAERLAREQGYQALVLGDSLGQVASQTMENLVAVNDAVRVPLFRPVIGFDKLETEQLVKSIGLYDLAIEPYKDCCSIIATHPATRANLQKIGQIEAAIEVEALAQTVAQQIMAVALTPSDAVPADPREEIL